jgi:hypothetical protein
MPKIIPAKKPSFFALGRLDYRMSSTYEVITIVASCCHGFSMFRARYSLPTYRGMLRYRLGTTVKVNSGAWQPSPHELNREPPHIQCPLRHINHVHNEVEHLKYLEHLIIHCYLMWLWSISIRFSVLASGDGCYAPELTFTFVPSLVHCHHQGQGCIVLSCRYPEGTCQQP